MFEELFGLNLPLYIIFSFFLSYLIWSKFINKGEFKLNNRIDSILEILAIFFIIFTPLMGFSIIYMFLLSLEGFLDLNIELIKTILNLSQYAVLITIIILIYMFLIEYTNKQPKKDDFRKILEAPFKLYSILAIVYLGLIGAILMSSYEKTMLIGPIICLSLLFLLYMIWLLLFKKVFDQTLFKKTKNTCKEIIRGILILMLTILGLSLFLSLISIPSFEYKNKVIENYLIFNSQSSSKQAYEFINIPIEINGISFFSLVKYIPINYGNYNLETSISYGDSFSLSINNSNNKEMQKLFRSFEEVKNYNKELNKKYGFTATLVDENKKYYRLYFDPSKIVDENVNLLILSGYVKKNLTDKEFCVISSNFYQNMCKDQKCSFDINITNNLDLPVNLEYSWMQNLNNLGIKNISKCRFSNITSVFSSEGAYDDSICNSISHCLSLRNKTTGQTLFYGGFDIGEEGTIYMRYTEISKPMNILMNVSISCE